MCFLYFLVLFWVLPSTFPGRIVGDELSSPILEWHRVDCISKFFVSSCRENYLFIRLFMVQVILPLWLNCFLELICLQNCTLVMKHYLIVSFFFSFYLQDCPEVHTNAAETLCAITRYAPPGLASKISSPRFLSLF